MDRSTGSGHFGPDLEPREAERVRVAQKAFARRGWELSDDGQLRTAGVINLKTGGRAALDEQLARLQGAINDAALAIGSAKDLLEAIAKFVLDEIGGGAPAKADFDQLMFLARDRLGLDPKTVTDGQAGAEYIRPILGSAWKIAGQVNKLRNAEGTGHGRTLPTGVTPEMAVLVVREACNVGELMLRALDRALGR